MPLELPLSDTWYEQDVERGPVRTSPAGETSADACIIGGGLAGLTAALELARRNLRVILLEAKRLAWGASGRNGGFVSNGFAEGIGAVAARAGDDAAKSLYVLSRQGTEFIRREIATHDPSIAMGNGSLIALRHGDVAALRAECERMNREHGENFSLLGTGETRALLDTRRYFHALVRPQAFHIQPLRYALLIARLAEKAGAALRENSPALSVEKAKDGWRVVTKDGGILARNVVHCVSSLDRGLHPETGRAVLPVATYVAVTEKLEQDAIRTRSAVSDTRRAGNYYRLIDGGRILWGGAITMKLQEPARLAAMMKRDMLSVYPQLGDPRIDFAWSGLMGYALHKMPLIGQDDAGQWYATAFGGHGLNTSALAGILLARAIAEGDDEYRRFAPFAPRWAGGTFGRAGVQASYWRMQWHDRMDEMRAR